MNSQNMSYNYHKRKPNHLVSVLILVLHSTLDTLGQRQPQQLTDGETLRLTNALRYPSILTLPQTGGTLYQQQQEQHRGFQQWPHQTPATNTLMSTQQPLWSYQEYQPRQQQRIGKRFFEALEPSRPSMELSQNNQIINSMRKTTPSRTTESESTLRQALIGLQNPNLFSGDILIKSEDEEERHQSLATSASKNQRGKIKFVRSAMPSSFSLWPNGVIPFELDPSVEHLADAIWMVMQQFHQRTCVRFVPRQNNEADYLRLEARFGCFSYIGRAGGEQIISLGSGCEHKGIIAHELLHAIGFYHQQNRSDRDDYLEILWENIASEKEKDFIKLSPHENLLLNEFDYNSIMLYGPRTFGKTLNKVTMKPKREGVSMLEIMDKQGLSALDYDSVKKLYNC